MGTRQIKCESCDQYYSASRSKCPHCGAKRPVSSKRAGIGGGNKTIYIGGTVLILIIILVIFVVTRSLNGSDNPSAKNSPSPSPNGNGIVSETASPDSSAPPLFPIDNVPVEIIYLSKTECTLFVETFYELQASLTPMDATSTVFWSSTDPNVASVDESGRVTGVGAGTTTIYAMADTAQATCQITVYAQGTVPSGGGGTSGGGTSGGGSTGTDTTSGVKLSNSNFTLSKSGNKTYGKTYTLKLKDPVANTWHTKGEYYSSDTKVATVSSSGVVTAVGKGHCVVSVTYEGVTYKADVYVKD